MSVLNHGLHNVATALFEHLNTPTSLKSCILLRHKEWDQLVAMTVDPINYMDSPWGANQLFRDMQACNFLRKSPLVPLTRDLEAEAVVAFHECEAQCATTNYLLKLVRLDVPELDAPLVERMRDILSRARRIATRILGELPDDLHGRFGPGTSAELKGSVYTTGADKLWITPHVTADCRVLFEHDFWRTSWGRHRLQLGLPLPETIRGNRFTTVPKDATKRRGICIEPLGNLWVQLGIGGYLKRRLSQVGLHVGRSKPDQDLFNLLHSSPPDGQSFHREMARVGSLTGKWATIDLSNASDTVALELVREVLPPDWFDLLYACRSPYTNVNGSWHRLEKFSSMGNGFTFELETLVFVSLLGALGLKVGEDLFCYGDDILLPEREGQNAMAVLKCFGFTPNGRKSFLCGSFKESCGGDYFSGFSVRSCYSDTALEQPTDWIVLHNQLKWRFPSFGRVHHRCVQQVPVRLRVFGPPRLGDRCFHGRFTARLGRNGYHVVAVVVPTLRRVPLARWSSELSLCLASMGYVRNRSSNIAPSLIPRGTPVGYRIRLASVS